MFSIFSCFQRVDNKTKNKTDRREDKKKMLFNMMFIDEITKSLRIKTEDQFLQLTDALNRKRLKKEIFTPKKNAFLLDQLCFHLKFFLHSCSSIQYYFFTVPFCFQYQRDQRMSHSNIKVKQYKYLRTVIAQWKLRNSRYLHPTTTRPCYHVHPEIMKTRFQHERILSTQNHSSIPYKCHLKSISTCKRR